MAIEEEVLRRLRTLKLGREEYCQRLLTMLILDGPYPPWNSRNEPSTKGVEYLSALDALCFGTAEWSARPTFVDEFELAKRNDEEAGAAPDHALMWEDRLWMIELKTEASSHRPAQIPTYLRLARHHYPSCRVHLTYLTPEMAWTRPASGDAQLAHVTWRQVLPLITDTWGDGDRMQRQAVKLLVEAIGCIGSRWSHGQRPKTAESDDLVKEAVALAEATSRDGRQRALNYLGAGLEELQRLRLEVKEAIGSAPAGAPIRFVRPWLWNVDSSTGRALTHAGRETGYEIRLSRYR
ncbi:hypothetical protein, partial [Actinomadura sp.]